MSFFILSSLQTSQGLTNWRGERFDYLTSNLVETLSRLKRNLKFLSLQPSPWISWAFPVRTAKKHLAVSGNAREHNNIGLLTYYLAGDYEHHL